MSENGITRFRLDPNNPPKSDWAALDAMTEDEIHAAALADPDAQPATPEQLARARRVVQVQLIRDKYGLSQEEFARRFGLQLDVLRGWEDGSIEPDRPR
ncbi:MAG: transcriptional regulator [Rhodospirillales bacterium]|nr:transcriptional regulator [Rhodospirillales bacterium]